MIENPQYRRYTEDSSADTSAQDYIHDRGATPTQSLPVKLEVWCCPSKHDKRIEVYLGGTMNRYQELVYVYKRYSNDDEYSPQFENVTDALEWVRNSDAECKVPAQKLTNEREE